MVLDNELQPKKSLLPKKVQRVLHQAIILFFIFITLISQVGCKGSAGSESSPVVTGANSTDATQPVVNTSPAPGAANLNVRISDAPFPYDSIQSVVVTVSSILAHIEGAGFNRFFQITHHATTMNLLELRGGLSKVLVDATLPNGTVHELRLMIANATITLKDGRTFALGTPSGAESGIKVLLQPPLVVSNGIAGDLMLDFNVADSVIVEGNPSRCDTITGIKFKPVIRVGNANYHGTISGEVYGDNCTPNDPRDDHPIDHATIEVTHHNFQQIEDEEAGDDDRCMQGDTDSASLADLNSSHTSVGTGADGKFIVFGLRSGVYDLQIGTLNSTQLNLQNVRVHKVLNTDIGRVLLAEQNCSSNPTDTSTVTTTSTNTSTSTVTSTDTSVVTSTSTDTGTTSATSTDTSVVTSTSTDTSTASATSTDTSVVTSTSTDTSTASATSTDTSVVTSTSTDTSTATATSTDTGTAVTGPTPWTVMGFDATTQATSMQIFWQSAVPTTGVIAYGTSPTDLSTIIVDDVASTSHITFLENLIPNTTYYLQVTATDSTGLVHQSLVLHKTTKIQ